VPSVVVVDVKWPQPGSDAGSQRTIQIIDALQRIGFRVHIAAMFPDEAGGEPGVPIELGGAERIAVPGGSALVEYLAVHAHDFDVVYVCWTRTAQLVLEPLRAADARLPLVFDTLDVNHVREFRHARVTGNANILRRALAMKAAELAAVAAADITIAISEDDATTLRAAAPDAHIEVVTMSAEPRAGAIPGPELRRGAVYLGNYMAWHNVDAATYLCAEIVPILDELGSRLPIALAGAGRHELVDQLESERAHVVGYVDNVVAVFDRQRMFVCPLRVGSGVKGKLLTAMSAGLPIVATSIGAEGVPLVDGRSALIADTPREFAAACVRLERDDELWRTLSEGAREVVVEHFSPQVVRDQVKRVFEPFLGPRRAATAR
jgi:glycosyltransferase involved in cell wall biosynthesis